MPTYDPTDTVQPAAEFDRDTKSNARAGPRKRRPGVVAWPDDLRDL